MVSSHGLAILAFKGSAAAKLQASLASDARKHAAAILINKSFVNVNVSMQISAWLAYLTELIFLHQHSDSTHRRR